MDHGLLQKVLLEITKESKPIESKFNALKSRVYVAIVRSFLDFPVDKLWEAKPPCSDIFVIKGRY